MIRIFLNEIYYRPNKDVAEYLNIFFETNIGILKNNVTSIDIVNTDSLQFTRRLDELDKFKEKYGTLYIDEVRITYDNNMYLLISGKFILAIEYVLNSNFRHSVQEVRIIENIDTSNKIEFDDFKELDTVRLPGQL